jgi:GNAT superfamily N-acetyltransferase
MFANASVARRIEAAEASLVLAFASAVRRHGRVRDVLIEEFNDGVAAIAGEHCPFNKIAGLGFGGLDESALERVEREYARLRLPLQAEVATLADPDVSAALTRRGYVLSGFENVLGLALDPSIAPPAMPPGVAIRKIDPAEFHAWIDAVTTGFLSPDTFDGPASHESFGREALERVFEDSGDVPGFERYLVTRDGTIAGGGSMRLWNGVAQLSGAATLPEHRRHGIQSTLLRARLAEAAAAGCDLAVVTTSPGSKSQENVQKQGFHLLYSRAILIRQP